MTHGGVAPAKWRTCAWTRAGQALYARGQQGKTGNRSRSGPSSGWLRVAREYGRVGHEVVDDVSEDRPVGPGAWRSSSQDQPGVARVPELAIVTPARWRKG